MQKWDSKLWLFTVDEFNKLPTGIELTCIDGSKKTTGVDDIDMDTRFGHIAYGVIDPFNHPEAALFSVFKLSK